MSSITCSKSFKVTDFSTNRKLMYDFLLAINTNLLPILHRFRDIAFDTSKIEASPLAFNFSDGGVPYIVSSQVIYR